MKKVYRSILISAIGLSVLLLFTRYSISLERLFSSFGDFFSALVYYFKVIFLNDNTYVPTVNALPDVDLGAVLGIDVPELVRKLEACSSVTHPGLRIYCERSLVKSRKSLIKRRQRYSILRKGKMNNG